MVLILDSILDFQRIQYTELSFASNTLNTFASLNYESNVKIETCEKFHLILTFFQDEECSELFSNLSKMMKLFPKVHQLVVKDPTNCAEIIDKVFLVSSKEKDYHELQQIDQLTLRRDKLEESEDSNDSDFLCIFRYNCPVVVLANGKITY
jgi:hypothetical protein